MVKKTVKSKHGADSTCLSSNYLDALEMDNVSVGITILEGKDYKVTFANPAILKIWNKTKADVINTPLYNCLPELSGQGLEELLKSVLQTGKPYEGKETPIIFGTNGDTRTVYFNFVYNPILNNAGQVTGIFVMENDVTAAIMARQLESTEKERLNNLFMQAPAAIAVLRGENHVFELVNPIGHKILGSKRAIIGKTLLEALPELASQGFLEMLNNVFTSGKPLIGNEIPAQLDRNNDGQLNDVYFNFVYEPLRDKNKKVDGIFVHAVDVTEQVRARQKVEELAAQIELQAQTFDTALTSITDFIYTFDTSGRFTYANKPLLDLLGISQKQIVGKNFHDLSYPKKLATRLQAELAKVVRTGRPCINEAPFTSPLGKYGYYEYILVPILDKAGKVASIGGSTRNITDRKQVQDDLFQAQTQLQAALSIGLIGAWTVDIKTNLVTASESLARLFGADPVKAMAGKLSLDVFVNAMHPDDRQRVIECISSSIQTGKQYDIDYRVFGADGKERSVLARGRNEVSDDGVTKKFTGVLIDITKRKKVEKAFLESEERLRFMAETMPQKVFTAKADGEVDYFNPQWMEFTGLSLEQIRDWGWTQFIHPDDVEKNVRLWKDSLATGQPYQIEHRFRRYDGVYHWHLSRAQPMRDQDGNVIRWFGSCTDIEEIRNTVQRRDELEAITLVLKEQRAQLVALNESKDEFISLASHQLRTPASAVKQFLSMVLEGYAGDLTPEQQALLTHAHESNQRQIAIVNDLLKVAQVDAGKIYLNRQPTDMVSLMNDVMVEQAAKFKQRQQDVSLIHKSKSHISMVDNERIRMVLENLIDNASKYTKTGRKIVVNISQTKAGVLISIQDEGVGIAQQDLDKLFRKFSRVDNPLSVKVGGSGLGLYWAKKIIDLHGGSIDVKSESNKGSTFSIRLPAR